MTIFLKYLFENKGIPSVLLLTFLPKNNRYCTTLRDKLRLREAASNDNSAWEIGIVYVYI